MGFRFRKSIKIGPARINLSKSGVGYSVGGKGFRFTKKAGGGTRTTASIPGTGISYTSDSKKGKHSKKNKQQSSTSGLFWKFCLWFIAACVMIGIIRDYWRFLLPVALLAAGGYWAYKSYRKRQSSTVESVTQEPIKQESVEPAPQEEPDLTCPESEVKTYEVAGVHYYEHNIISMLEPNYLYKYKKQELIDLSYTDEAIYKDTIEDGAVEIIPEPTNPHDPNAIKVLINGNLVGYIPANDCAHLLSVIQCGQLVSIAYTLRGGKYKIVNEDYDCTRDRSDYSVDYGEDDFGITLYIRENI